MRAVTWHGRHDVRVDTVPDPEIVNPRDCDHQDHLDRDLRLRPSSLRRLHPGMRAGDILGHENMGEVVEVGAKSTLKKGQRVVIPFTISCGSCFFCSKQQFSACDNSNPAETADPSEIAYGHPMGGAFGYAHLTGGYAGGQAEYLRVPYSDVGPIVIPDGLEDDKVLFLSATSCRPAGRRRSIATSSPATRSRCGAAARSGCSRSSRRSCSARTA